MTESFRAESLTRHFGGLRVTNGVSLSLNAGERVGLIGPNGAGKTTLINLLAGRLMPNEGRVWLGDEDITATDSVERTRMGIVRTFQISRLFSEMTPTDHVLLAVLQRKGKATDLLRRFNRDPESNEEVSSILERLGLAAVADRKISHLAYGEQRLLEIAIALALKPRVLLMDEPAAGVAATDTYAIERALDSLPGDLSVLMIEHDIDFVFRFAQRVVVLGEGAVIFEGKPDAVSSDSAVRKAYLGNYAHAGQSH